MLSYSFIFWVLDMLPSVGWISAIFASKQVILVRAAFVLTHGRCPLILYLNYPVENETDPLPSFAFACLWFCRSRAITGSPVHPIGGAALVADPEIPPNTARIG
jgi:hypothetical protein